MSDLHLTTREAVLDALGGYEPIAKLTGCRKEAVWMWFGSLKKLPAKTYVVLQAALAEKGMSAADSLWNVIPASEAAE